MNMDGPLWNCHYVSVSNGGWLCFQYCGSGREYRLANIAPILAQYPGIQVYENRTLVPGLTNQADMAGRTSRFQNRLSQAMGRPITGMFMDTMWDAPSWIQPFRDLRKYTHERNMHMGWYIDGSAYATSDAQWINSAESFFEYAEDTLGIYPDDGIFASWNSVSGL